MNKVFWWNNIRHFEIMFFSVGSLIGLISFWALGSLLILEYYNIIPKSELILINPYFFGFAIAFIPYFIIITLLLKYQTRELEGKE